MESKLKDLLIKEKKAGDLILLFQVLNDLSVNNEVMISQEELSIKMNRSRPTIKKLLIILENKQLIKNQYGKIILGENNE